MKIICGRTGDTDDLYDDADYEDERMLYDATEAPEVQRPFYWSQQLQQSFREELEKLVTIHSLPCPLLTKFLEQIGDLG
jgi:predicted alpha/beta hydrolase family esterase